VGSISRCGGTRARDLDKDGRTDSGVEQFQDGEPEGSFLAADNSKESKKIEETSEREEDKCQEEEWE